MFHGLFTFSGDPPCWEKIKIKVHYKAICITKITKYHKDTTSVHSQLVNSSFLSHKLSCLCPYQQQLLNFINLWPLIRWTASLFSYICITWKWSRDLHFYLRFGKGTRPDPWNIKLIWCGLAKLNYKKCSNGIIQKRVDCMIFN